MDTLSPETLSPFTTLRLDCAEFPGEDNASYMGGCQNYGPFLSTLNIRCGIIIRIRKGTIILTTTHMPVEQVHSLIWPMVFP